jgi:hypothetical protein
MLSRPVDPPPALEHLSDSEPSRLLREANQQRFSHQPGQPKATRLRALASRVTGRSDRRLLRALIDVTESLTTRCDVLADRMSAVEAVSAEVAEVYGVEITLLRAEVERLRASAAEEAPPNE